MEEIKDISELDNEKKEINIQNSVKQKEIKNMDNEIKMAENEVTSVQSINYGNPSVVVPQQESDVIQNHIDTKEQEINDKRIDKGKAEEEINANNKRLETIDTVKHNVVLLNENFTTALLTNLEAVKTLYLERNNYAIGAEDWITKSNFSSQVQDNVNQDTINHNIGKMLVSVDELINNVINIVNQYSTNFQQLDQQLENEIKN